MITSAARSMCCVATFRYHGTLSGRRPEHFSLQHLQQYCSSLPQHLTCWSDLAFKRGFSQEQNDLTSTCRLGGQVEMTIRSVQSHDVANGARLSVDNFLHTAVGCHIAGILEFLGFWSLMLHFRATKFGDEQIQRARGRGVGHSALTVVGDTVSNQT